MVDVGLGDDPNSLALRVHVRTDAASLPRIPAELDGIPVQVVRGDYRPE